MSTADRVIGRFIVFAMGGFVLLGVGLLGLSILQGFDFELFLMGMGSLAWMGLLALAMQPWRE
ncbi:MAG: hypothetical protein R3324_03175 [Halobacteriales archaeon]|nr:hypothetical protein [Halobacteriales archaeon]